MSILFQRHQRNHLAKNQNGKQQASASNTTAVIFKAHMVALFNFDMLVVTKCHATGQATQFQVNYINSYPVVVAYYIISPACFSIPLPLGREALFVSMSQR